MPFVVPKETRDSTAVDRRGITIVFLDMACIERLKKGSRTAGGAIDSVATSISSWSAVLHCLRGNKHDRDVLSGQGGPIPSKQRYNAPATSLLSHCRAELRVIERRPNTRAVPLRQSNVTMLLQPLCSHIVERNSVIKKTTTVVTVLVTAYPGHRDFVEKLSLLNDMELLLP
jgi:hypothetical protein